jgi:CDP-4-dehydro-6-deoxyglucose reductase
MSFKVHVEPSGHEFDVEAGESILEAALNHGINLPYGCRNGFCGNCQSILLAGKLDYPDGPPPALDENQPGACLTCQGVPLSDIRLQVNEINTPQDIELREMPCKVDRIERLNDDVIRLYLKLPEGERLQFLAGQYLNFILESGERRAFSIANAPHDDAFIELHIRHVMGGTFTDYLFSGMQEKTIMRIEAPLGTYFLREDSDLPIILMGGGTGFAPLKGIIEHAFAIGVQRPIELYWGARKQKDIYLPELPVKWLQEHENFKYVPVLSEPEADWQGRNGWVHESVVQDHPDLRGFEVYMSGPPPMIDAAKAAFLDHGLDPTHLYSDSFEYGAKADKN